MMHHLIDGQMSEWKQPGFSAGLCLWSLDEEHWPAWMGKRLLLQMLKFFFFLSHKKWLRWSGCFESRVTRWRDPIIGMLPFDQPNFLHRIFIYLVTCCRYLLIISSRAFWCSSRAARSSLFSCCRVRICLEVKIYCNCQNIVFKACRNPICAMQANVGEVLINLMWGRLQTSAWHANSNAPWPPSKF